MTFIQKISILCFTIHAIHSVTHNQAIIIVPVADLVGAPIKSFKLAPTIKDSYKKIALCGGPSQPTAGCPRIFQILAHEIVDIISIRPAINGDESEACIAVNSAFFVTHDSPAKQNLYWTLTKNLLSFTKLLKKNSSLDFIPATPDFKHKSSAQTVRVEGAKRMETSPLGSGGASIEANGGKNAVSQEIYCLNQSCTHNLALIKPFYDPVTQQTFSAGTRFVYNPEFVSNTHYQVYVFDRKITRFITTMLPKSSVLTIEPRTPEQAIQVFVAILKSWAHTKNGIICYVWGGASYTYTCKDKECKQISTKLANQKKVKVYIREDCNSIPLTGFDCAGMILRAAQICNIPYFFKNTYTLAQSLAQLKPDESLNAGDLIWIPGHVMVVSDIQNNLLIEARGYSHGFGKVQEMRLEKVFKGIKTYDELINAFFIQKPLIRLDKSGKSVEEITYYKLLKLSSVWNF